MNKNKSDFQKFCETTWIMVKYDFLPWLIVGGLATWGIMAFAKASKPNNAVNQIQSEFMQKQK